MTEEKVKNRGWVKNVAIIFLSIMLVLTFFSNTIMNRSLPEVAAQYAQSGSITTRIRGNGKIEATETYEVKSTDSRKVKSVMVRLDEEVEVGDLLFVLAEGDSDELEQLKATLADQQYNYQVKLINLGSSAGSGESRAVARAREKLEYAIADRDSNEVSDAEVTSAKAAYDKAVIALKEAENKLAAAGGDTTGGSSGSSAGVESAMAALDSAKLKYDAAMIQYKNQYELLQELAKCAYREANDWDSSTIIKDSLEKPYAEAICNAFTAQNKDMDIEKYFSSTESAITIERGNLYLNEVVLDASFMRWIDKLTDKTLNGIAEGYQTVAEAYDAVKSAEAGLTSAQEDYYNSMSPNNSALMKKRDEAKLVMTNAEEKYNTYKTMQDNYEVGKDTVIACQDALEAALISEKLNDLDLSKMAQEIAKTQQQISDLGSGGEGGEIRAEVAGVIKSMNVTAGNSSDPTTAMCTIEVPDRGYMVSMSVTADQAKKVTVGDSAEISTGYWGGSNMQGRLVSIKTDPQNPQSGKLLIFEVTGENIQSEQQVSISIGQRSQNYEVIVPKSAVRSDTNGSFVLIVEAKSSPLNNRYVATRVDVQVLAEDDSFVAVSGVAYGDFVITTSTSPIESGMLVRMPEN